MSGFVANTPAAVETDIINTDFFPTISPVSCRAEVRLDQNITPQRLRAALINAMHEVNQDLAIYKKTYTSADAVTPYATLAEVPADSIDGASVKIGLYTRAVYCFAKAELIERYRDYDSTLSGNQNADDLDPAIDDYRRQGIIAIRAITGAPRSTIELI